MSAPEGRFPSNPQKWPNWGDAGNLQAQQQQLVREGLTFTFLKSRQIIVRRNAPMSRCSRGATGSPRSGC